LGPIKYKIMQGLKVEIPIFARTESVFKAKIKLNQTGKPEVIQAVHKMPTTTRVDINMLNS